MLLALKLVELVDNQKSSPGIYRLLGPSIFILIHSWRLPVDQEDIENRLLISDLVEYG